MLDKTDSIEDIDSNDANEEGVDCDVIQLKKSNSISMTKRQSKLERLKSENFSDIELSEAIGTLSPAKKSGGPALKDRTDKFLFLKNRLSPRKNTSFKNIFSKRYSPSKLSPWVKKENPFLKVNKEVIWGAQEKSSKDSSSFSEKIDDKLYKQISHFTAYEPSLELVDKNEKHKKAKFTISCHTLKNLMKENQYEGKKTRKNLIIIDCRYDYEYSGGHIMGAINHNNPDSIYEELFPSVEKIRELMEKDSIIVLHCEFSQCRAPMTYDWIRKKDRELNGEKYPLLFYPELYVLENGYKEFYGTYPEFCEPQGYVPMDKKEFRAERDYFEDLRRPY